MPAINEERLLADLRELRTFGGSTSHPLGVVRPSFSEPDMEARRWLRAKFEDAGLIATIDGVGNVVGRSPNPGPALLLGSHSDTQPRGGWLDGAMGVVYALEAARALAEDPTTAHLAVDIASWTDEEGTYLGMIGCKSFCGLLDEGAIAGASSAGVTTEDGEPLVPVGHRLTDAIASAGLTNVPREHMDPDRYAGYFEAHIEQGPWLEHTGNRIGVVSGCVGISGVTIDFIGQQNHAGTTPMHLRADAGMVAIKLAAKIDDKFKEICSESSVWTFGKQIDSALRDVQTKSTCRSRAASAQLCLNLQLLTDSAPALVPVKSNMSTLTELALLCLRISIRTQGILSSHRALQVSSRGLRS
jgi:N-carbamoyl-L-amino-acid hydrolase